MAKRGVRYPHTIGFRVSDETWFAIQQEISETDLTAHDWCRLVVLDRLNRGVVLSKSERILFAESARTYYLVANAFKLLADDNLTTEEWERVRHTAREKIDVIAERALEHVLSRMQNNKQL
jgi:hypothetical protein